MILEPSLASKCKKASFTLDEHFLQINYWSAPIFLSLNFIAFSGFEFRKTMDFVFRLKHNYINCMRYLKLVAEACLTTIRFILSNNAFLRLILSIKSHINSTNHTKTHSGQKELGNLTEISSYLSFKHLIFSFWAHL